MLSPNIVEADVLFKTIVDAKLHQVYVGTDDKSVLKTLHFDLWYSFYRNNVEH